MFSIAQLHRIRDAELARVLALLPPGGGRLLEIGSGTGYQAKILAGHGYEVTAIDLPSSEYLGERVYPVRDYDGTHLPVPDRSIDIVFSSNVLEHVRALGTMLAETQRVLAPGGLAVHIMPSPSWRFWTLVAGWPDLLPLALERLARLVEMGRRRPGAPRPGEWAWETVRGVGRRTVPVRHGERGNALTELWSFGPRWWCRQFARNGFAVERVEPIGLFYTGVMLFGPHLSLAARARLSRLLGSAGYLYIVRPQAAA